MRGIPSWLRQRTGSELRVRWLYQLGGSPISLTTDGIASFYVQGANRHAECSPWIDHQHKAHFNETVHPTFLMVFGFNLDALRRMYPTRQVLSKVISEGLEW